MKKKTTALDAMKDALVRARTGTPVPEPTTPASVPPSGVLSSARGAKAEYGAVIFETVCDGLAAAVGEAFKAG